MELDNYKNNEGFTLTIYQDFLRRNDLSLEEKSLFLILLTYGRKNGKAFPKIDTLKFITKKSHSTIIKILRSLQKKGFLEISRNERDKKGVYANNVYFLKNLPMPIYRSDKLANNILNNNNKDSILSFNGIWNE